MVASVAAAVVLVVAGVVVLRVQREREWGHGGDRLTVGVDVALAGHGTFDGVAVRLGTPAGEAVRVESAEQTVVVRVRWSGSPWDDGSYQVIALDGRLSPPRPLAADGGWNSEGGTGSNWGSAYAALAQHYEWLGGTARADFPSAAVSATAAGSGTVTAWFHQWGDGPIPFADTDRGVVVALVYLDDSGEARWARRIFG